MLIASVFSSETKGIEENAGLRKALDQQQHAMAVLNTPYVVKVTADNQSLISELEVKNEVPVIQQMDGSILAASIAQSPLIEEAAAGITQPGKITLETSVLEIPVVPIEKSTDVAQSDADSNITRHETGEVTDVQSASENVSKSTSECDREDSESHRNADNSSSAESDFKKSIRQMYTKQMARVAVFRADWKQMEEASSPRDDDADYVADVVTLQK